MTLSGLQNSFVIAPPHRSESDLLHRVRRWLDALEIDSPKLARLLCKIIPAHCPFERDIQLFGRTLFQIPPLCKLNPLYEQFVGLRFRALSFLADECGEDISAYCR
ncbi:Mo-dependent nitrogenase C-terminal domain-containing protein [Kamptonema formosum]|uniref:Mo-dependent nitrogenase C-terminal domain-containing protein n=1 Tax=Kamptonema formosum TaxID=331992 RepID=UPI000347B506|nr:Mo-dependent nitrogenase C-terminal domain-containing protein [Oscillatoria sp. PCC 10802]